MINEQTVEDKLNGLKAEVASLESTHNAMVAQMQKQQEGFQQTVANNQNRWQQLTGARAELEKLRPQPDNGEVTLDEVMTRERLARHEHKPRRSAV